MHMSSWEICSGIIPVSTVSLPNGKLMHMVQRQQLVYFWQRSTARHARTSSLESVQHEPDNSRTFWSPSAAYADKIEVGTHLPPTFRTPAVDSLESNRWHSEYLDLMACTAVFASVTTGPQPQILLVGRYGSRYRCGPPIPLSSNALSCSAGRSTGDDLSSVSV